MIGNVISKRYASALFQLGNSVSLEQAENYGQSLFALALAVSENKKLEVLFNSPVISDEEKKKVILSLLEVIKADIMVKRFFELLVDRKRLSEILAIANDYKTMLDKANGLSQGHVITAIALDNARQLAIKEQLETQNNCKLQLEFSVKSEILGGIILTIGDRIFDASLRSQLNNLRESIKRGE